MSTHDMLFLSAVSAIVRKCSALRAEAERNPIYKADDIARINHLADRQEAKELRDALDAYKRGALIERETVRNLMAAE